jgi:hypothetical protein
MRVIQTLVECEIILLAGDIKRYKSPDARLATESDTEDVGDQNLAAEENQPKFTFNFDLDVSSAVNKAILEQAARVVSTTQNPVSEISDMKT